MSAYEAQGWASTLLDLLLFSPFHGAGPHSRSLEVEKRPGLLPQRIPNAEQWLYLEGEPLGLITQRASARPPSPAHEAGLCFLLASVRGILGLVPASGR
jgi:hypothetical protein